MTLTPLDIRRQQFAKALRGYDPAEVDAFLKQVSDQQEGLLEAVRRAEERTREAEAKLTHYERVELALQEALESARATAQRAEAGAEEKARLIVEQAELRAERVLHDAERERSALRQDVAALTARRAEATARLRAFLVSELEVLARFQAEGDPTVAPAAPPAPDLNRPTAEREPAAPEPAVPEPAAPDDEPAPLAAPLSAPEPTADTPSRPAPEPVAHKTDETSEAPDAPPAEPASAPEADDGAADDEPAWEEFGAPVASDEPTPDELATRRSAPEEPAPEEPATEALTPEEPAPPPRAVTGGWDLRSLVTGEDRSAAASEAERERIRRILDDLD